MSEPSTQRLRAAQAESDDDEPSTRRLRASQEQDDEPATQLLRPAQERVEHPPVDPDPGDEMAGPAVSGVAGTEPAESEPADNAWYDTTSDGDGPRWTDGPDGEQAPDQRVETVPAGAPDLQVEHPAVEPPAVEYATAEPPAVERPAVERPAVEPPAVEPPAVEPPAVERPAVERPAVERPAVEWPAVEWPAEEHPTVEIPVVAYPAADAPAADDATERTVAMGRRGDPRAGGLPAGPAAPGPAATRISPNPFSPTRISMDPIVPAAVVRPRVDSGTAAELTEDAIVRFRGDRPRRGWRGAVYTATGGLVNPGIGASERHRQEQLRRIRRPLPGSHHIAVSSIKGGVGKTTVSACLGLVLAEYRGDRVIALDANPDAGTLADRLTAQTSSTVRNLLRNIDIAQSLTEVARFTSFAGRLQVLASEQDPAMSEAFSREEYEQVCAVLTRFYNIVITDSGTGLVHSAMEGTLALAQSLVVVGSPTVDGASRASKTLDWLIAHGYSTRVADAVVVLSCDRTSKEVDRGRVREHFEARCRAVVEVPHDPHLATGGRIQLDVLRRDTLDAFIGLAAILAEGFGGPEPIRSAQPEFVPSLGAAVRADEHRP